MIKTCEFCGNEFDAKSWNSMCCNRKCSLALWRKKHKNIVSNYNQQYYQQNSEQAKVAMTKYRENHKDKIKSLSERHRHSYDGHIISMVNHALDRAKRFNLDCEPKEVLLDFVHNNKDYKRLYDAWVASGFQQKYTPSIDRIDVLAGYTIDNMQIITHSDNVIKGNTIDRQRKLEYSQEIQINA